MSAAKVAFLNVELRFESERHAEFFSTGFEQGGFVTATRDFSVMLPIVHNLCHYLLNQGDLIQQIVNRSFSPYCVQSNALRLIYLLDGLPYISNHKLFVHKRFCFFRNLMLIGSVSALSTDQPYAFTRCFTVG